MQVDDAVVGDAIKRLRRAEGQIRGVIEMLESGRDCADIVTQLYAVGDVPLFGGCPGDRAGRLEAVDERAGECQLPAVVCQAVAGDGECRHV